MNLELLRAYVRVFILLSVFVFFGYMLYEHVGLATNEIEPKVVWSYLTGLVNGVLAYYLTNNIGGKE